MDLNKQQLEAVNTTANKVLVVCSAASGKTTLLAARVNKLLKDGVNPDGIVVFSFTNMSAQTLRERIGDVPGLYIGTIHSYANKLLTASGVNTRPFLKNEQFDELFPLVKAHPECLRKVEYLFLDEAQDSCAEDFEFILKMIQPANWFLVGDIKQSIYRFRGAEPTYLSQLSEQSDVTTYHCDYNYRNGYRILSFAKRIIEKAGFDYIDTSIAARDEPGIVYEPTDDGELIDLIESHKPYGDWFVLARTNNDVYRIQVMLDQYSIPNTTFKQGNLTPSMLEERMNEDTVKVLTIHSAKGLERRNTAVFGARYFNTEERCVAYVAATRAMDYLAWFGNKKKKPTYGKTKKTTMSEW